MNVCSLGHLGLAIAYRERFVIVDPLTTDDHEYGPEVEAQLDSRMADCHLVVVTSASPLHAHSSTLVRLLKSRTLVAPAGVLRVLPRELREVAACQITLESWQPVDHEGLTFLAISSTEAESCGVMVWDETSAALLVGSALPNDPAIRRADREYLGLRARLMIVSGYLDHPLTVLQGSSRGFPFRNYHRYLLQVANIVDQSWPVALVGGLVFSGRASWLNAFAAPITLGRVRGDLLALAPDLVVSVPEVGQFFSIGVESSAKLGALSTRRRGRPFFDPTWGVPEMEPHGMLGYATAERISKRLLALGREDWWLTIAFSCRQWDLRVAIRELGSDGERTWTLHFVADDVRIGNAPDLRAQMQILLTASGLSAILDGHSGATELALRGHLRSFEKVHEVRGGAVRRPSWIAHTDVSDRMDLMSPLPSAFQLLDSLTPTPPTLAWRSPDLW